MQLDIQSFTKYIDMCLREGVLCSENLCSILLLGGTGHHPILTMMKKMLQNLITITDFKISKCVSFPQKMNTCIQFMSKGSLLCLMVTPMSSHLRLCSIVWHAKVWWIVGVRIYSLVNTWFVKLQNLYTPCNVWMNALICNMRKEDRHNKNFDVNITWHHTLHLFNTIRINIGLWHLTRY